MGTKARLLQVVFLVTVSLWMGAMGHTETLTEAQAQLWLNEVLFNAGTAQALGQGAYAPPLPIVYDPSYAARSSSAFVQGDPAASDIFGLHWFTNLMVTGAAANSAAAPPGFFGFGLGSAVQDQLLVSNAQARSSSTEEMILNFMLSMNANDPRLTAGAPVTQTSTQITTQTTPQTSGGTSASGNSGGHYGWLTSGMY